MTSPFDQYQLIPIGEYKKEGSRLALRLPTGNLMLDFDKDLSHATLKLIADQLNAEIVVVKGTWTFVPDKKDD